MKMEDNKYVYVRKALKAVKTLSHFGWLGIAVVSGSQYLADDNAVVLKFKDVQQSIEKTYADVVLKEKNLEVFNKLPEIRKTVDFLYGAGEFEDLHVRSEVVFEDLKNLQSSYAKSNYGDCTISIRVGKENKDVIDLEHDHPVLNLTDKELDFKKQKTFAHELGHCVFSKDKNVFKVDNSQGGSFAQINKSYGGDTYAHYEITENDEISSNDLKNATIHRLANEGFADAFAAITLLRQHNATDDIKTFLYKSAAKRDLTTSFWDYNYKEMQEYKIFPYDIAKATTKALEPENVKKALEASSPQEVRDLAAKISKENTLEVLAKLSPDELEQSLGNSFLKEQAIKSIGMKGFATGKIKGEYLVNDFFVSMAKATDKNTRALVAETRGFKKESNLSAIPTREKFDILKKYGDTSNEVYKTYKETFEEGKTALFKEIAEVRNSKDIKDKKTEIEVIGEYQQNIDKVKNPMSVKGKKTELEILDEAQNDIGLNTDKIKSLRQEFLETNKPDMENKKPIRSLS